MSTDAERLIELEQELLDAYEQLDERDRELEDLREGGPSASSGGGRTGEDSEKNAEERERLISDLEKYREELMESKDLIADLQANLSETKITQETLQADKKALAEQVEGQKKIMNQQKSKFAALTKESDAAKKQQKDGSGQQYQLELENQRLRAHVTELEENEAELVGKCSFDLPLTIEPSLTTSFVPFPSLTLSTLSTPTQLQSQPQFCSRTGNDQYGTWRARKIERGNACEGRSPANRIRREEQPS